MKKRLFSVLTVLALCLSLLPTAAGAVTSLSGAGTEADPYTISSTADLAFFVVKLTAAQITKTNTSDLQRISICQV